jgi:hypothetical protein
VWGRREIAAFGAALAVVVVVAVGYGLTRGQQVGAGTAAGRDARVERVAGPGGRPAGPVTDQERRDAAERRYAICRDLEVRLAYNGPLEAMPAQEPGPTPSRRPCERRTLSDAEVLAMRGLPATSPGSLRFADERQLAEWKRDQLCRRPAFRAAASAAASPSPTTGIRAPAVADALRGICTTATLGPDEIRALRSMSVQDPAAAERARLQREREIANLTRTAAP